MIDLRKISTTAFLATALIGSTIPFAYAMNDENASEHIKVPFSGIRVTSAGEGRSLLVSVEEEPGSGRFRLVESSEEAEKLITLLTKGYNALPESAKIVTPPTFKIHKREEGQIGVKEEQKQDPVYRYLGDENVNDTLQTMLTICTETYKKEEERQVAARQARKEEERRAEEERQRLVRDAEQAQQAAERAEQERIKVETAAAEAARAQEETIRTQAESLKMQQDIAAAKALLAKQQQEQAAAALKQQQEEYAALQVQLAAQQADFARQQEEARAAHQAQLAAQLAAQQAEFAKQQEAEAAAAAAQQQQILLGGRSPERVAHNINKETERAVAGVANLLSGKSWKSGRKKK